jgi:succinate dehydrogenase / fumarate reductase, cytochrome b subunit
MSTMLRTLPRRVGAWVDPRSRTVGSWAFILNRISALGLTLYLFIHLVVLGKLAQGPEAYDSFVALARSPLLLAGELLVVLGGLYHGLNGLRIALTSFGIAVPYQRRMFYAVLLLTIAAGIGFALRMFEAVLPWN